MRMSLGNRQFTAALGWGFLFAALSAPGNGATADEQTKPVRTDRSSVAEVGASIHATQARASLGQLNEVHSTNGHPILSRIPYLSRLFVNAVEPATGEMPYCLVLSECGDDSVERIGVDFDFSLEGPQTSRGVRVASCPNAPSCRDYTQAGRGPVCPEMAGACDIERLVFEQLLQKEMADVDCGTDCADMLAVGNCDGAIREKLAAVSAQATILTHLSEMQTELVEARMEMAEKLVETRLEYIEQLTQLTIENERLKTKLEFQKEREEFQAKIAELTAQNQTAKMQAAYAAQLQQQEASHTTSQHAQAYAQLLQSHQLSLYRIAELEGKAAPRQPTERREEVAERTDRTAPTRSQY